ncbi:MAG: NAD(P)/FAD-dependent oxidoreductase [Nostocoides sp.]
MVDGKSGADVVVVGAGIVGVCAAYELARSGVNVRLLDKGIVCDLQSSRNWGFVRRQGCDPLEVDLVQLAAQRWDQIGAELGPDLTLVRSGLVTVEEDEAGMDRHRAWLSQTGADDRFGTRLVGADEVRDLVPVLQGEWAGGLFTPTDGHADPAVAGRVIADAARRHGAVIEEGVTVTGITTAAGRVTGVSTSTGMVSASSVIVAAGAWTGSLLRPLGLSLPVRWIRATAARTTAAAPVTELAVHVPGVGFSQAHDGSVVFGSAAWSDYDIGIGTLGNLRLFLPNFARNRKMIRLHLNEVLLQDLRRRLARNPRPEERFDWPRMDDPPPNRHKIALAHQRLTAVVPGLAGSKIARAWAGTVDVTPDALPVVAPVEQYAGLVVAAGLSSHGFGIGPGVASVAVALATGDPAPVDIREFRLERFAEGPIRAHHH